VSSSVMVSGRPSPGEYADYAQADIDGVAGHDIVVILGDQIRATLDLLSPIGEARAGTFRYSSDKWTVKEVVGHLSDDERIFAYRALCVARNDPRPLPGFEEKDYVRAASFQEQPLADLLEELRIVRQATIALARGLSREALLRRGLVNGYGATARGLLFHIAGHELHHVRILKEKYLAR
jgi:uncharacterized damage-inducible protein DinB